RCDYSLGNHIILYAVVVFFVVVIPFIFWRLKGDADAHGIRREIWVTMGMGIPCFIIFVIWQTLFKPPTGSNPAASMRGIFGPSNWLVIVTTTYHIMTVVVPVFRKLTMTELSLPIRRQSISIIDSSSVGDQEELMMLELTTDSLESALRNPLMLKVLQTWAIKDFSVENILFYDRYLHLAQQL
ncbi:uncharacterized protein BX663DRAFT_406223, partial [Cokeromyces recurvatus]|uniref:uncharacterized protein n=1 Tax=Cokeromyces recurvatus TaxID=90255 RepID=UPI00221F2A20